MRLFQALLAGARTGSREREWSGERAAAFEWLERRSPPSIWASKAQAASAYVPYVPLNQADKEWDRQNRLKGKPRSPWFLGGRRHRPLRLAHSKRISQGCETHIATLSAAARHIGALGWGIDLVVGCGSTLDDGAVSRLEGERWGPLRETWSGAPMWRVPHKGSPADVERCYREILVARTSGVRVEPSHFGRVTYARSGLRLAGSILEGCRRHVYAFKLVAGEDEPRAFNPKRTIHVAAQLRHAAHLAAKKLKLDAPFVSFVLRARRRRGGQDRSLLYIRCPPSRPEGRTDASAASSSPSSFGGGGAKARAVARRLHGASRSRRHG